MSDYRTCRTGERPYYRDCIVLALCTQAQIQCLIEASNQSYTPVYERLNNIFALFETVALQARCVVAVRAGGYNPDSVEGDAEAGIRAASGVEAESQGRSDLAGHLPGRGAGRHRRRPGCGYHSVSSLHPAGKSQAVHPPARPPARHRDISGDG